MKSKKPKIPGKATRISNPFDITTHRTEWTCAAKLAEWMNSYIKDKNLPLGTAEVETIQEGDRKRVDIILFDSPANQKVLCVIETKQPYFDVFNESELKEPARKKAVKRKAPYFATCNFQWFIWFNTERVNKMDPEERQILEKYHLSEIEDLDYIEEPRFKNPIITGLSKFLQELVEVSKGKKPEPLLPIDEFLIFRLHEKVNRLARYYRVIIRDATHKDTKFQSKLQKWFIDQQWQFTWKDSDYDKVARQTAYLLINKILFYYLLKAKKTYLASLEIPEDLTKGGQLQAQLQAYFSYVLKKIDYETIYSTDFIDQTAFPDNKEVVCEIKDLVNILKRYDFSEIGYEIIGNIFQRLIPQKEQHKLGQYFTNPDIVDLILRFCLKHEKDKILDPSCGAGTFLMRAYKHKKIMNNRLSHRDILETLWGVDIAKFPSHLATINLALQDLGEDKNYPNIAQEDFFNLLTSPEGLELPEKWRKIRAKTLGVKEREITYPRWFDCIVGNPPYTRQEEIPDITGKLSYKKKLIKSALYNVNHKKIATISKRAGIYVYFFIHGMKFLRNGGRFGFIVSNSWLDVDYGRGLQEFFLKNYKIVAIIESKVERWFETADINTCIVILEKCKDTKQRNENFVKFVYLFKPLRHFVPPAQKRWEEQIKRVDTIDSLIKTILAHKEFYQNEEIRIYPKLQKELWMEGYDKRNKKYAGSKWGKYIRAPEPIIKKILMNRRLSLLGSFVKAIMEGEPTGANEFFFVTREIIKKFKIENTYLHPAFNSPKDSKSILITQTNSYSWKLLTNASKEELKGTNILKYIKWGERKGFRKHYFKEDIWYSRSDRKADLLIPRGIYQRFICFYNVDGLIASDRFVEIFMRSKELREITGAFLNSTLYFLLLELYCRTNLGQGALDIQPTDIRKIPIPDLTELDKKLVQHIQEVFEQVSKREVNVIFEELGVNSPGEVSLDKVKPDRRELDKIVMGDILGLTEEEQLEVYRAVVDLVSSRIKKAKSVERKKKIKGGIDIDAFVKTVIEGIGKKTLAEFYQEKILTQKPLYTKKLPKPTNEVGFEAELGLKFEKEIHKYRLNSGKKHIFCKSEPEARYLKVWIEAGLESVKVPKDEDRLVKIVPQLERLMEKTKKIIESYTDSILQPKLRQKIFHQIWQKLTEGIE